MVLIIVIQSINEKNGRIKKYHDGNHNKLKNAWYAIIIR